MAKRKDTDWTQVAAAGAGVAGGLLLVLIPEPLTTVTGSAIAVASGWQLVEIAGGANERKKR